MPGVALTVGEMRAAKWHVIGTCTTCRLRLWVDLDQIAAAVGADALFWGRTGRCRAWKWGDDERCKGVVIFTARSIRGGSWRKLAADGEVRSLWWRRQHPGEDPVMAAFKAAQKREP